jgi:hypothetical protein
MPRRRVSEKGEAIVSPTPSSTPPQPGSMSSRPRTTVVYRPCGEDVPPAVEKGSGSPDHSHATVSRFRTFLVDHHRNTVNGLRSPESGPLSLVRSQRWSRRTPGRHCTCPPIDTGDPSAERNAVPRFSFRLDVLGDFHRMPSTISPGRRMVEAPNARDGVCSNQDRRPSPIS